MVNHLVFRRKSQIFDAAVAAEVTVDRSGNKQPLQGAALWTL